jgi:UDP-N-acetyl-D-glucosamine dehydrogenase
MSTKETLIKKLKEKKASIGILGLGYVGLPLAVVFAEADFV